MATPSGTNPETLVTLKINIDGTNKRYKLPLRDLGASALPDKLRYLLSIPATSEAIFERYSDSAAAFVVLDPNNTSVYKQLYRAAKAKLKLRLKVTIKDKEPMTPKPATVEDEEPSPVSPIEDPYKQPTDFSRPNVYPESSVPAAVDAAETAAPPSVNELQSRFEELLINHPRFSNPALPVVPNVFAPESEVTVDRSHLRFSDDLLPCVPSVFNQEGSATVDAPKTSQAASNNEIPVTRGAAARDRWFAELADLSHERQSAIRNRTGVCPAASACTVYSVYCNECNGPIPDEHYHCSTCDDGDYDLCQSCIDKGILCGGADHWMIKRFVKNGKVINSTTETLAPKKVASESKTTLVQPEMEMVHTRTCNSCISELSEENFVTCLSCEDYDLCIPCHLSVKHGHHPKHTFAPAVEDADLDFVSKALLSPGRNVAHNAICDGCDKYIYGVRNKCLDCPDWDYCSDCIVNASNIHPRHRFVPMYEPLHDFVTLAQSYTTKSRHHGIYCDGPLCRDSHGTQTYIRGDRYKCAVCHDTDFCASCEASPSNPHNKTHPLIKFKTPVRNVSVTTMGDNEDGRDMPVMGDRRPRANFSKSTSTTTTHSANAATQVQTVADLKPSVPAKVEEAAPVKVEEKPVVKEEAKELPAAVVKDDLVAWFVRDTVADGTMFAPSSVFEQTWYLRNGGKTAWPAGCTVKFVGGDNMCAVDPSHPASVHELVSAAESTTCYTEVAPGQEYGFTVLMRTPSRAGNFISYWRLTGPDGEKFGHRLWCDVHVKEAVKEQPMEDAVSQVGTETEGSQMIFPKLEKESPATSMHQESVAPSAPESSIDEFDDFADEPLEDDETEDGFMTDEEYDILDASDEEYLAEQEKTVKK